MGGPLTRACGLQSFLKVILCNSKATRIWVFGMDRLCTEGALTSPAGTAAAVH